MCAANLTSCQPSRDRHVTRESQSRPAMSQSQRISKLSRRAGRGARPPPAPDLPDLDTSDDFITSLSFTRSRTRVTMSQSSCAAQPSSSQSQQLSGVICDALRAPSVSFCGVLDFGVQQPVTSVQQPVTSVQQPVTSVQQPVTSVQQPAGGVTRPRRTRQAARVSATSSRTSRATRQSTSAVSAGSTDSLPPGTASEARSSGQPPTIDLSRFARTAPTSSAVPKSGQLPSKTSSASSSKAADSTDASPSAPLPPAVSVSPPPVSAPPPAVTVADCPPPIVVPPPAVTVADCPPPVSAPPPAVTVADCPVCLQPLPSSAARTSHLKLCGERRGLSVAQLLAAVRLQHRQAGERAAAGLPATRAAPHPPAGRRTRTAQQGRRRAAAAAVAPSAAAGDADLQMALAVSASLRDEEERTRRLAESQLLELGLGDEVEAARDRGAAVPPEPAAPALPPATDDPPVGRNRGRGGRRKAAGPAPVLLTQTKEERERRLCEKVAQLLAWEEEVPVERRRLRARKGSPRPAPVWEKAAQLHTSEGDYYVSELVGLVEPCTAPITSLLKDVADIPGRSSLTQKVSGEDPSSGSEAEEEAAGDTQAALLLLATDSDSQSSQLPAESDFQSSQLPADSDFQSSQLPADSDFQSSQLPADSDFQSSQLPVDSGSQSAQPPADANQCPAADTARQVAPSADGGALKAAGRDAEGSDAVSRVSETDSVKTETAQSWREAVEDGGGDGTAARSSVGSSLSRAVQSSPARVDADNGRDVVSESPSKAAEISRSPPAESDVGGEAEVTSRAGMNTAQMSPIPANDPSNVGERTCLTSPTRGSAETISSCQDDSRSGVGDGGDGPSSGQAGDGPSSDQAGDGPSPDQAGDGPSSDQAGDGPSSGQTGDSSGLGRDRVERSRALPVPPEASAETTAGGDSVTVDSEPPTHASTPRRIPSTPDSGPSYSPAAPGSTAGSSAGSSPMFPASPPMFPASPGLSGTGDAAAVRRSAPTSPASAASQVCSDGGACFAAAVHPGDLGAALLDLLLTGGGPPAASLLCSDGAVTVHAAVLAVRCPPLYRAVTEAGGRLLLPEVDHRAAAALVRLLYLGETDCAGGGAPLPQLLLLAERFGLEKLARHLRWQHGVTEPAAGPARPPSPSPLSPELFDLTASDGAEDMELGSPARDAPPGLGAGCGQSLRRGSDSDVVCSPGQSPRRGSGSVVCSPVQSPRRDSGSVICSPGQSPRRGSDSVVCSPVQSPRRGSGSVVCSPVQSPRRGSGSVVCSPVQSPRRDSGSVVCSPGQSPERGQDEMDLRSPGGLTASFAQAGETSRRDEETATKGDRTPPRDRRTPSPAGETPAGADDATDAAPSTPRRGQKRPCVTPPPSPRRGQKRPIVTPRRSGSSEDICEVFSSLSKRRCTASAAGASPAGRTERPATPASQELRSVSPATRERRAASPALQEMRPGSADSDVQILDEVPVVFTQRVKSPRRSAARADVSPRRSSVRTEGAKPPVTASEGTSGGSVQDNRSRASPTKTPSEVAGSRERSPVGDVSLLSSPSLSQSQPRRQSERGNDSFVSSPLISRRQEQTSSTQEQPPTTSAKHCKSGASEVDSPVSSQRLAATPSDPVVDGNVSPAYPSPYSPELPVVSPLCSSEPVSRVSPQSSQTRGRSASSLSSPGDGPGSPPPGSPSQGRSPDPATASSPPADHLPADVWDGFEDGGYIELMEAPPASTPLRPAAGSSSTPTAPPPADRRSSLDSSELWQDSSLLAGFTTPTAAEPPPDSRQTDAGTPSVRSSDAGTPRVRSSDAGTARARPKDAGTPGMEPEDAGTPGVRPEDSGTPDAGMVPPQRTPVNRYRVVLRESNTPMPNYVLMLTPELKRELTRIGVKPIARRKAVALLSHIYEETHPPASTVGSSSSVSSRSVPSTNTTAASGSVPPGSSAARPAPSVFSSSSVTRLPSPSGSSAARSAHSSGSSASRSAASGSGTDGEERFARPREPAPAREPRSCSSDSSGSESSGSEGAAARLEEVFGRLGERLDQQEEEEEISASQAASAATLAERLRSYIVSRPELYHQVLTYEPVWLESLYRDLQQTGVKLNVSKLMNFLDDQCITFRTEKSGLRQKSLKKWGPSKKKKSARKKVD